MTRLRSSLAMVDHAAKVQTGRFIDKLPPRDMEPTATAAWRAADTLSLCEPSELQPHIAAMTEARDKLDAAIERAMQ